MLNDAVRAKQQGVSYEEAKPFEVEIGLDLDAYIPESYIQDEGQKIQMYKRIQALESIQETYDLNDELLDRFGSIQMKSETYCKFQEYAYMEKRTKLNRSMSRNKKSNVSWKLNKANKLMVQSYLS